MLDNVIPFIGGEEEKSEIEPLKLWGHIEGDKIVDATTPNITTQCLRVPVSDGHMAAVFVSFAEKPSIEQIKEAWAQFSGPAQALSLIHILFLFCSAHGHFSFFLFFAITQQNDRQ